MIVIWKREYFYGRHPTWVPAVDENWQYIRAASIEDATRLIAELRAREYHLRPKEYMFPDYGIVADVLILF